MKTKPFDLEKAKQGAKLVTRAGNTARFIAHIPDAHQSYRVSYLNIGSGRVLAVCENGKYDLSGVDRIEDLFLLEEPVRRDWKLHEVPVNHWFRRKGIQNPTFRRMVGFVPEDGSIVTGGNSGWYRQEDLEHSADGIEWKECGIYE